MLKVTHKPYILSDAECRYAECHLYALCAECLYAECRFAECHFFFLAYGWAQ
jgi:hypothetical protein